MEIIYLMVNLLLKLTYLSFQYMNLECLGKNLQKNYSLLRNHHLIKLKMNVEYGKLFKINLYILKV